MKPSKFINLMISLINSPTSPHKPQNPEILDRKNSFVSLKRYLPRTWIILFVFFLQILLLLSARNFHVSTFVSRDQHLPENPHVSTLINSQGGNSDHPASALNSENSQGRIRAQPPEPPVVSTLNIRNSQGGNRAPLSEPPAISALNSKNNQSRNSKGLSEPPAIPALGNRNTQGGNSECPYGKVYVYDLPKFFNTELLENCHDLNPWGSRCDTYTNYGLGRPAKQLAGIIPASLAGAWFWTDQFASEIIYHNRMLNYRCRTLDGESATAYYIPLYAGLAVGKYLWTENYTALDRDRHCEMMLSWVRDQPYWNKSDGWDHFLTMGRITWDFRRSKKQDWGSGCIYLPGMRNITRLLIERNSWDYFDVGVPYPTGFHPTSSNDVATWQDFVRTRTRDTLFCFAGATRGFIKNDFRGLLLNQCYNSLGSCRVVDCSGLKCSNGSSLILESFLGSDFCLQPRGDSFTRRSIFDCMIAGSVPVFFWNRTAYSQYEWFLPGRPESYSVFIDKKEVLNGVSIKEVLEKYGKDEVRKMREKVIEYIPRIVYAKPHEGIDGMKDAFDVAVEGVLKRVKDQEQEGFKW